MTMRPSELDERPARVLRGRWPAIVLLLVTFAVLFYFNAYVRDDAFIAFRSADNLVRGEGPRWNVGERVQAFTSPLALMGAQYLKQDVIQDPITLVVCAVAVAACWTDRRTLRAGLAVVLHVLHILLIGGDFLGFRLWSPDYSERESAGRSSGR